MAKHEIQTVQSEILLYQGKDGKARIETRLVNESIWLTQKQLSELFQTTVANVNVHIKNIFGEGELEPKRTIKDFLTVQIEGDREVQRQVASGIYYYRIVTDHNSSTKKMLLLK